MSDPTEKQIEAAALCLRERQPQLNVAYPWEEEARETLEAAFVADPVVPKAVADELAEIVAAVVEVGSRETVGPVTVERANAALAAYRQRTSGEAA